MKAPTSGAVSVCAVEPPVVPNVSICTVGLSCTILRTSQIQSNTNRHRQSQPSTARYSQTPSFSQSQADTVRHSQTQSDTRTQAWHLLNVGQRGLVAYRYLTSYKVMVAYHVRNCKRPELETTTVTVD